MTKEEIKAQIVALKNENAALDAAQSSIKLMMNSCYGAFANTYFRYFDVRIASAITTAGQVTIRGVSNYCENKIPMVKNIYNDTDSIFLKLDQIVDKRFPERVEVKQIADFILKMTEAVISPTIAEYFDRLSKNLNMRRLTISLEPECISDVCFFKAKKKYAMKQVWVEGSWYTDKTKLKVKGIEIVRTSTPQFCRDTLKKCVELIFTTQDNNEVNKYIREVKEDFFKLSFEEKAFPRGVNGLGKYSLGQKGVPIHVRAALIYNQTLTQMKLDKQYHPINEGDKLLFGYVKIPNRLSTDIMACPGKMPEEILTVVQMDDEVQFAKAFMSPIESIYEAIGWDFEKKQTSLEDFF